MQLGIIWMNNNQNKNVWEVVIVVLCWLIMVCFFLFCFIFQLIFWTLTIWLIFFSSVIGFLLFIFWVWSTDDGADGFAVFLIIIIMAGFWFYVI